MKAIEIKKTCGVSPTQFEIKLEDGRMIYFRFRWGYLSIKVSPSPTNNIIDAVRGKEIFGEQISDPYDGCLENGKALDYMHKAGIEINPLLILDY